MLGKLPLPVQSTGPVTHYRDPVDCIFCCAGKQPLLLRHYHHSTLISLTISPSKCIHSESSRIYPSTPTRHDAASPVQHPHFSEHVIFHVRLFFFPRQSAVIKISFQSIFPWLFCFLCMQRGLWIDDKSRDCIRNSSASFTLFCRMRKFISSKLLFAVLQCPLERNED